MGALTERALGGLDHEVPVPLLHADAVQDGAKHLLPLRCVQLESAALEIGQSVSVVRKHDLVTNPPSIDLQVVVVAVEERRRELARAVDRLDLKPALEPGDVFLDQQITLALIQRISS